MTIISWLKTAYYKQFYNLITIKVPLDSHIFKEYNIASVKYLKDDIRITLIKKP